MDELTKLKRQVERWERSLNRWYDKFDAIPQDEVVKRNRVFSSDGFTGARSLLIAAQAAYIAELEKRVNVSSDHLN